MEIPNVEIVDEREIECIDSTSNPIIRSKILHHFIKGNISLSSMDIILIIFDELESLESLVELARKKCNKGLKMANLT